MDNALAMVSRSDIGRLRTHNEDAVHIDALLGLAILADGMGGYNAGEVASGMATQLLRDAIGQTWVDPGRDGAEAAKNAAVAGIAQVNQAIYSAAQSQAQYAGMGTTLVMALFHGRMMTVAHVGDSRLYRLRAGKLGQLTRDHSLLQEQLDRGLVKPEDARRAQHRNLVTRALGVDPDVDPDVASFDLRRGDVYLLCSDGLNDMVEDAEIEATLRARVADLDAAAATLVQQANDAGGRDNVSVILVRIGPALKPGWLARVGAWLRGGSGRR